jgi:hypothetical protein
MARPGLRLLVAAGLGLAAGVAALLIATAAGSDPPPELCVGIGLAAAVLVQLVRETGTGPEPPDATELVEPDGVPAAGGEYLSRLRQLERRLEAASADGSKYDRNVRPLLARLATDRLRQKYGIHPGRQPAQARQVLGEQLWSLTIAPTAQPSPAPSHAELAALVARIEAL